MAKAAQPGDSGAAQDSPATPPGPKKRGQQPDPVGPAPSDAADPAPQNDPAAAENSFTAVDSASEMESAAIASAHRARLLQALSDRQQTAEQKRLKAADDGTEAWKRWGT